MKADRSHHERRAAAQALLEQGCFADPGLAADEEGFVWLAEDDFVNHFAGDVDPLRVLDGIRAGAPILKLALERALSA